MARGMSPATTLQSNTENRQSASAPSVRPIHPDESTVIFENSGPVSGQRRARTGQDNAFALFRQPRSWRASPQRAASDQMFVRDQKRNPNLIPHCAAQALHTEEHLVRGG